MSTIARHDITVHQGMIVAEPFAPTDPDGLVIDYTGYSATFNLYASPATLDSLHDLPPILSLSDASGAIEVGLMDSDDFGEYSVLLYLTQQQTSVLEPWGRGVYNLDIIDPFGHPQLRIRGVMQLEEGAHHG